MLDLINRSFTAPVPVKKAWAYLAKVEQWSSWAKHIKRIEIESGEALNEKSIGAIYLQNGVTTSFSMIEFNPNQNWKWVGKFLWFNVHYDHRFHPIDNQNCEMTFLVAAEGFGVALFGRLFALIYNRNLDKAIPNLIQELQTQKYR